MSAHYPGSDFGGSGAAPQAILSANLAAVRGRGRKVSVAYLWAGAGLLMALAMTAMLYLILVDNVAQVQNKRLAHEQQVRERHRCAMLQGRLERDQCLVALIQPVMEPVTQPALQPGGSPEGQDATSALAQR